MKASLKVFAYLVLLGGFALRLYRLGANSLWYDETVSLFLAQSDLAELIRHTAGDIHPPFYYLLLHFWGRLAGWSESAAAFLSLWFGVLLIALVYRVSSEWFRSLRLSRPHSLTSPSAPSQRLPSPQTPLVAGEAVALLAAFLVACSPYNIWYSQEVRMYTLGATLGLLSVYFLRRMVQKPGALTGDLIAYAIVTVFGFYTLYYFVFLMVFEWLWVVSRVARRPPTPDPRPPHNERPTNPLFTFLLSQLAVVLLYLPWLPIAFRQATEPPVPPWREFIALPRVLVETFGALAFGQSVDPKVFGSIALLLCIPIGALLWRERTLQATGPRSQTGTADTRYTIRDTPSAFFLLGYFLIPLAAIYLFSLWKPLYHVRYMFTYSPAFYILVASSLVMLVLPFARALPQQHARAQVGAGALAVLVSIAFLAITGYSLNNFWHNPQYADDDLRGAVNMIAEHWRPGDVILVNAGYAYPALAYYFPEPIAERTRLVNYPTTRPADPATAGPIVLQTGSIDGAKNLGWNDPQSDFYATTAEETRAALDRVFANHPRVWMLRIYDTVVDPKGVIRAYLTEHATLLEDQPFGGDSQTRVQGFIPHPTRDLPPDATRVNKNLGERVELVGYEPGAHALERGAFFDVVLYWKLLQAVNHNYQVTLQLLNEKGENVAQYDETPLSELLPMTRWQVAGQEGESVLYREPLRLKIPAALAPGEYRAIVKLYEPRSGEVLGEVIELGSIQVH